MVADVQVHQLPDAVLIHGLRAPLFIGHDHLPELGAPVPQVIDAHGFIPKMPVNAIQRAADGGAGQVVEAEGLGDVDGGIVQHHVPAPALVVAAVGLARVQHLRKDHLGLLPLLNEKVEVRPHGLRLLDARGQAELLLQLRGDGVGGLSQDLGELEAGEGDIPHAGVLGRLQQAQKLLLIQAHQFTERGGHGFGVVHRVLLPLTLEFTT